MKTTRYRIVDVSSDRVRSYVADWLPGTGALDHYLIMTCDVRRAHVFEDRTAAIEAAERIEARIVQWRGANPDPDRRPRNPVRIVPTTGGTWVEWTPRAVEPRPTRDEPRAR
jgi:hypothetical protein